MQIFNLKLIISILIFSILLITTSMIKTKTRIIEKRIYKIDKEILTLKRDLHETQLDFYYLSSPEILSQKINEFSDTEYSEMDFSRIYLDIKDFTDLKKKITDLEFTNDKKKKE